MPHELKLHRYTEMFPGLSLAAFAELTEDIRAHGQRVPILLYKGAVADGKHRYAVWKALDQEGMKRKLLTEEFEGSEEELLHAVISLNEKRRHLTDGQLAAIAVEIEKEEAVFARARQSAAAKVTNAKKKGESLPVKSPEAVGDARDKAAARMGVGGQMVSRLKAVKAKDEGLFNEVKAGTKTVNEAWQAIQPAKKPEPPTDVQLWTWANEHSEALLATLQELKDRGSKVTEMLSHARAISGAVRAAKTDAKKGATK